MTRTPSLKSCLKMRSTFTQNPIIHKQVTFADCTHPKPRVSVKTSGFFVGLTSVVDVYSQQCHAFFDSGASVNIIKTAVFDRIVKQTNSPIHQYPPDITVYGISGNTIMPHCKVKLELSFSSVEPLISDYFYVIDDPSFSADVLIGYHHTMSQYNISLFPATRKIAQNCTFFSALPEPHQDVPINYSQNISLTHNVPQITNSNVTNQTDPTDPVSPPESRSLTEILSSTKLRKATLTHSTVVSPADLGIVKVKIKGVPPGTDILILSESCNIKGIQVESVLTTVRDDNTCAIAVKTCTDSQICLRSGVALCDILPYPASVTPIRSEQCNLGNIGSEPPVHTFSPTPLELQHLGEVDYPEKCTDLLALLTSFRSCVSLPGETLGRTDAVQHEIHLVPGSTPTYVPAYRIPHSRRTLIDDAVRCMLEEEIVEPCSSPFNAPLFLVPKQNGEWRVVVDFRSLNSITVPDRFPMPVLSDLLQSIGHSNCVFSTIDLQSGFFQVDLEENSRQYTAFTTSTGQYAFKRMAMGLRNSPLTFMRLMTTVLSGLIGQSVYCYLDDVIIASKDLNEHLQLITEVLTRFSKAGLTIKLNKCQFLKRDIKFLGHRVNGDGIHTSDDKIKAIRDFPTPNSVDDARSFVGLAGFYRQFIHGFSQIASPITSLFKKDVPFTWSEPQALAFNTLKDALCNAPVLAFPDFDKEFSLCTDASDIGIGAVLLQKDSENRQRTIAYASRLLNPAEQNYSVTDRESLAVVWALRHFRDIILGYQVHVLTDHYAVTEMFKGKNLTGKYARWYLTVQEYNPKFSHIPGRINKVADALSRHISDSQPVNHSDSQPDSQPVNQLYSQPHSQPVNQLYSQPVNHLYSQPVSQIDSHPYRQPGNQPFSYPDSQLTAQPDSQYLEPLHMQPNFHLSMQQVDQEFPSLEEVRTAQQLDNFCTRVITYLESGDDSNLPKLSSSPDSFILKDNVLYKTASIKGDDSSPRQVHQLVIPAVLIPIALFHIHDSPLAGHPGKDRAIRQARRTYFWSSMRRDIIQHCSLCTSCAKHRPSPHYESPNLAYPIPHAPWDSVSVDLMKLPITENGFQYLLVCIDSFSRYSILVPLKDKTAKTVARAIIDEVICHHGTPRTLLSDNGTEFNNAILEYICTAFQIRKCNITPYSPQANGTVERANRRILDILRYISNSHSAWDEHIPLVSCSLNSSIHSSVNESPHYIIFGTDMVLPHELLRAPSIPLYNVDDYARYRITTFQRIHDSVRQSLAHTQQVRLKSQHSRARPHVISTGDVVYVRNHDRHSKLDPLFHGPYRVTELMTGHKVRILNLSNGTENIVHRDHLKRVDRGFDRGLDIDCNAPLTPHAHAPDNVPNLPNAPQTIQDPNVHRYQLRSHSVSSHRY